MSFSRKPNLNEPLVIAGRSELEDLTQKITENIDGFTEYIQILEEFDSRLGGKEDNRTMREQMKEEISEANDAMKRVVDLFRQFDSLNLKKKEDIEHRNKVMKRAQDNFKRQNEKFTKLLRDIQRKEKIHLQAMQKSPALNNHKSNASAYAPIGHGNDLIASEITADLNDLDFTETMLKERDGDLLEIRRLAHELNLTAQYQAKKVHEQSLDIELVEENSKHTESSVANANKELAEALKYQSKSSKRK